MMMKLKIKNFKCFGEIPQGFETVQPVNVLIGRNNSGKSSLLDLIKYACAPFDLTSRGHLGKKPEVHYTSLLTETEVKRVFPINVSNGPIPGNHWQFGSQWVGQQITVSIPLKGANKGLIDIQKKVELKRSHDFNEQLANAKGNSPLFGKEFRLLAAERDVRPEPDSSSLILDANGSGATNVIQNYLNKSKFPSSLIENDLLGELNQIFCPDSSFKRIKTRQLENGNWEIFLEEENKGLIALSQSGSGLKTVLLVLLMVLVIPVMQNKDLSSYILCFEELENNIHPALLRRLLSYLRNIAEKRRVTLFLTTHSSTTIDLFSKDPLAQIIHVTHDGTQASAQTAITYLQHNHVLDDLDIRASDILQSNGIIWVEGPSDRIYINSLIALWSEGKLQEGIHYQCVFYGGRLLAHLEASSPEEQTNNALNILTVNRNAAILIDSDKRSRENEINATKKRLVDEFGKFNGFAWITQGKEIENYIPADAISKLFGKKISENVTQYEPFEDYLGKISGEESGKYLANKCLFAEKICPCFEREHFNSILDVADKMNKLIAIIKKWNALT